MTAPPDTFSSVVAEHGLAPGARSDAATSPSHYGRACAVPVGDVVGSSHWIAEAVYRTVEIMVALVALLVSLPFIVIAALLIRLDSPGPALFFHQRPARSTVRSATGAAISRSKSKCARWRRCGRRWSMAPKPSCSTICRWRMCAKRSRSVPG